MKLIANENCVLQIDSETIFGDVSLSGPLLPAGIKLSGTYAIRNDQPFQVTNIIAPTAGATIPDVNIYTFKINTSSMKVYVYKKGPKTAFPILLGDTSDIIMATPKIPNPSGDPIDYPVAFQVKIVYAGQDRGFAE